MQDLKLIWRALRHKNYRLFFTGQGISLIGTWMQQVALSWLLYKMTNSPFLLGVVGFIGQIPTFLLAPLAGVVADRFNQHRWLILTQSLAMLQACILFGLVFTHVVAVWHIVLLSLFAGMINAFDIPLRQSFTIKMIEDKDDLSNAIALNSSMVNLAKLVGPSIGGILIVLVGESACFFFNALSYTAVIYSLLAMKVHPHQHNPKHLDFMKELKEGVVYAFNFVPIRTVLLLLGVVSLVGGGFQTLMPVFARDLFMGGPKTLGFLLASSGTGAFLGALYLASRKTVRGLARLIPLMTLIFGAGVIAFSFCRSLPIALGLVAVSGFGMMVQMAASNTILQVIVDEDKRGRVMSFYTMSFMGTAPLGSLCAGILARHWGLDKFLLFGGGGCIIGALLYLTQLPVLREKIRPIYVQKGIIPQVAKGIQSATAEENFPRG
jgi:MFS family permease